MSGMPSEFSVASKAASQAALDAVSTVTPTTS
jgi:hypothetical protein